MVHRIRCGSFRCSQFLVGSSLPSLGEVGPVTRRALLEWFGELLALVVVVGAIGVCAFIAAFVFRVLESAL